MALNIPHDTDRRNMMFLVAAFSATPMSATTSISDSQPRWARLTKRSENNGRMVATNVQEPTSEAYKSEDASGPLVVSPVFLAQIEAMCTLILPGITAETVERAAAMPTFIAEWISGSTDIQIQDRTLILGGLAWVDAEIQRRHSVTLTHAGIGHLLDVINDVSHPVSADPQLKLAGQFFNRLRALVIGGFYTPGTLITRAQPADCPVSPPFPKLEAVHSEKSEDMAEAAHKAEYQGLMSAFKSLNIDVMAA